MFSQGTRSRWTPGHISACKQFDAGWLCEPDCTVPADECVTPYGVGER